MPRPGLRSRSKRRVFVKTPKTTRLHYKDRKPGKAQCAKCGLVLAGVPNVSAAALKRLPKTKKRPERPFGGVLCSACSRNLIKERARNV